jgi:hypothetical protein
MNNQSTSYKTSFTLGDRRKSRVRLLIGFKLDVCTQIIRIYNNMRCAKNDEIESEVYDEFLSTDLTEQKELEKDDNNSDARSITVCNAQLIQAIE